PRALDLVLPELVERLGVVLRDDRDVTATVGIGLDALLLQPVAQRDVLGVAELGRRELRALELARATDVLARDEQRATGRRAGDDPHGAVRLHERVHGR